MSNFSRLPTATLTSPGAPPSLAIIGPSFSAFLSGIRDESQRAARLEARTLGAYEHLSPDPHSPKPGTPAALKRAAKVKKREDGRTARFSDRNYKDAVEYTLHRTRAQIEQLRFFLSVTEGATEVLPDRSDVVEVLDEWACELARSTYRQIRGDGGGMDGMDAAERTRFKNKEAAYFARYKGHHYKCILERELEASLDMLEMVKVATDDAGVANRLEGELGDELKRQQVLQGRHGELLRERDELSIMRRGRKWSASCTV